MKGRVRQREGERGRDRAEWERREWGEIFLPVSIGYDYIRAIKYSYYIPQEVIVCVFPI